jgi:hypothetical protein
MKTESQRKWPLDLRICGWLLAAWAFCLMIRAMVHVTQEGLFDPAQTIFIGKRFFGRDAQVLLYIESVIYAVIAAGMIARRRWAVVMALMFIIQVIASHLIFALAFVGDPVMSMSVRAAAMQGPSIVLIALYLWIRVSDLSIVRAPKLARSIEISDQERGAVRAMSRV